MSIPSTLMGGLKTPCAYIYWNEGDEMKNLIIYLKKEDLELLIKDALPLDLINNSGSPFTTLGRAKVVIFRKNIHLYFIDEKYKEEIKK